jgi:hypothetical protein
MSTADTRIESSTVVVINVLNATQSQILFTEPELTDGLIRLVSISGQRKTKASAGIKWVSCTFQ